jgi:phospholipase/carboxylesterase
MPMNSSIRMFGHLRCRVIDAIPGDESPRLLVMLNHGFGAPGDDLVDFAPMLMESSEQIAEGCRFVFPAAPIDLGPMGMPGGRAWWPINMARLAEINQTQNFEQLTELEPPGMREAGLLLSSAIQESLADAQLDESRLILGGFSQGAMVSTHVTLTETLSPSLLALFSGTLLNRKEWKRLAETHPGCPVLQSHGLEDPLLPFVPAVQLAELLSASGFDVEFIEFHGSHTIPARVLQQLQARIEERC